MADGGNRGSDRHDVKPFNLSEHRNARQHARVVPAKAGTHTPVFYRSAAAA
jgi:hypothetical protein